jgi:hypothetical protein
VDTIQLDRVPQTFPSHSKSFTLRHFTAAGKEIHYTGSSGDAVPVARGWLRASMRKVNTESPYHRPYLPRREYRSIDVEPVESGVIYECDVELWPTNVVVGKGGWLMLQVSSEDTDPGVGLFKHNSPIDRYVETPSCQHACTNQSLSADLLRIFPDLTIFTSTTSMRTTCCCP